MPSGPGLLPGAMCCSAENSSPASGGAPRILRMPGEKWSVKDTGIISISVSSASFMSGLMPLAAYSSRLNHIAADGVFEKDPVNSAGGGFKQVEGRDEVDVTTWCAAAQRLRTDVGVGAFDTVIVSPELEVNVGTAVTSASLGDDGGVGAFGQRPQTSQDLLKMPIDGRETGQPPRVGHRLMAEPELVTWPALPVLEAVGAGPNLDQ
ncbi:hypothetical protein AXG93_3137s1040 [Marchantia polymorpha subsp. ruderalis]|uniref:Uncharacterized protein n=1 Tax=Marchantia polymorpha subsp. ruderalis TaxID=1480154 RepID=A0A176W3Q5_MARPO|nr:hypothetical protein AXG93_3137s1040 [Marchantia polymorpha subsp. ruderalis]